MLVFNNASHNLGLPATLKHDLVILQPGLNYVPTSRWARVANSGFTARFSDVLTVVPGSDEVVPHGQEGATGLVLSRSVLDQLTAEQRDARVAELLDGQNFSMRL